MSKGKLHIWEHTWRDGSDNGIDRYVSMICYRPVPSSDNIWDGMGHLSEGLTNHLEEIVNAGYEPVFDRDPDNLNNKLTENEKKVFDILNQ